MNKLILTSFISAGVLASQAVSAAPTLEELWEKIQEQEQEIEALKKEQAETDMKVEATADAVENVSVSADKSLEWASKTKIGGYGEHHYNNNFGSNDDLVDAHRYVLFVGHEFSDSVRMFSEFELEHSLAGEGQPGEVELEQAYIEWDFAKNHALVAGLFLVPVGIMNETHEPNTFYGTERNNVEKNIIPTTWWETGALIKGQLAEGLSYDVAFHSGLKHDEGNIRSGRQKSANATANDFAYTARIKYTGMPGLELASTFQYQEDMSQGLTDIDSAPATLLEAHAVYAIADFTVRALYASWNIDGAEAESVGRDSQSGFYLEPSYKLTEKLGVFARYSEWNNTEGLSVSDSEQFLDYGVNYWLTPTVVFKADFSDDTNSSSGDSLNVGVGWSF